MHVRDAPRRPRASPFFSGSRLRLLPFGFAAVVLLWAIVSRSLIPALAPAAPNLSMALRPSDPVGVIAFVQKELAVDGQDTSSPVMPRVPLEDLRRLLQNALAAQPLNASIYSLLGLIAQRDGDLSRATALMNVAAQLSPHETIALDWLMRERFVAHDYVNAARYADLFLKNGESLVEFALPVLAQMSEIGEAEPQVEALLATQPSWRGAFLLSLNNTVTDPRTPLRLLMSLKDTAIPPRRDEVGAYLAFLVSRNLYDIAYYAWLQFLSPEQLESAGLLYNGSFLHPLSGLPFDWRMPPGVNYTAGRALKPDATAEYALNIAFGDGRIEFQDITQTIMLKPGPYRFRGSYTGSVIGPRGLQWAVRCLSDETLGEGPMIIGTAPDWRNFAFDVVVPQSCPVQYVRLTFTARSASEQLVSGSVWFDDLSITRSEPSPTARSEPVTPAARSEPAAPAATPAPAPKIYKPAASRESTGVGRMRSTR